MGNTSSIPPPLVSINAPGNDVLVPYGTNLYACPPPTSGYHPHTKCSHQQGTCKAHLGPVYSKVGRSHRQRHGLQEPDVRIREYEDESESTKLGEVSGRKDGKMQDLRGMGRRGIPGRCDIDPRPSSAPAGSAGLRGGQGHPGMYPGGEDMGMNDLMPYAGMYPGACPPGPGVSPHPSVPPQYASYESVPGYPHGTGGRNPNAYPPNLARVPPPSTTSSTSSSKSRSRPLPPAIQAAIDEAIQKSTGARGGLTRSKTSPATLTKDDNNDSWGDGIDTCICTTNCKCRKGERAVKWYEGMAKIGGEDVPVRAKLNTRYVLKDDMGKDCGDHSGCKKKTSSSGSSSSSDTETSKSKRSKRKSKKKAKKADKSGTLDDLQAELDMMRQAAAMNTGNPYGAPPFAGYGSGNPEDYDPEMLKRLTEMRDPYGMGRVRGPPFAGKKQGMYGALSTRSPRLPRMPPKPGMRLRSENDRYEEDYDDTGGASPLNPYAQPSAMRGKGRHADSMPPRRRPRFGLRRDLESDIEPSISNRSRGRKKGIDGQPRRSRAFELDDTDVSLAPRGRSAKRGFRSDGDEELAMYNLPKRGDGEKGSASPWNGWTRISPPGRKSGVRKGRTTGKQARAETDDDEDY